MQSKTFKRKNNKSKKSKRFIQNSKKRSNIKKMIGGAKAFILIDNLLTKKSNVSEARNYQEDALENTINNYTINKQTTMEHSYYGGTVKFTISKVNTRVVDYPDLNFKEGLSLYILIREDGSSSYISQNQDALTKLIEK